MDSTNFRLLADLAAADLDLAAEFAESAMHGHARHQLNSAAEKISHLQDLLKSTRSTRPTLADAPAITINAATQPVANAQTQDHDPDHDSRPIHSAHR